MVVSPRGILAIGLGLAGAVYLVAPTQGQGQGQGKADPRVQAAANGSPAGTRPAATATAPVAAVFGTVDLDFVFKNYDKVKMANKEIGQMIQVRKAEMMKVENEGRQEAELLQKMTQGSEDARKHENRLTEIKATMEAKKEQFEREITLRQAETMATLYKEVQAYVKWVANKRGMTYVMTVSNTPPSGSDPNSVLAAVNRPLIYADDRNDITNDVVYYLNQSYRKVAGPNAETKAAARQQPAGGAPAGAPRAGAEH